MRRVIPAICLFTIIIFNRSFAQQKSAGYTPKLEESGCVVETDPSVKTHCGYLIVPENRSKPKGRLIKLPYVWVESWNPNKKKDPIIFASGGPGYGSVNIVAGAHSAAPFLKYRDFIALDQRGTNNAIPCLKCTEIAEADKKAYQNNLLHDSLLLEAIKKCRTRLTSQGIDLSSYNTVESAADIEDLRIALKIDSMNLIGVSYSGGLMLTVIKNFPKHVRSAILDSPLPGFISYGENGLLNFNEALNRIFDNCERDSSDKATYGNLSGKFHQYFTSIIGKDFYIDNDENSRQSPKKIRYTRNELLSVIADYMSDNDQLKNVPYVMSQIIAGNHQKYIKPRPDNDFEGTSDVALGMRFSVMCSEQVNFEKQTNIDKQNDILPYLAGYPVNDVSIPICDCWKVNPLPADVKQPVYSNIPVLLGTGDTDPWCRPVFNDIIHHYMPNSQILVFTNRTHCPIFGQKEIDFRELFFNDPFKKIKAKTGVFTTR
jgi:pimeloyl-ACP methyl ester carboxylesterase